MARRRPALRLVMPSHGAMAAGRSGRGAPAVRGPGREVRRGLRLPGDGPVTEAQHHGHWALYRTVA